MFFVTKITQEIIFCCNQIKYSISTMYLSLHFNRRCKKVYLTDCYYSVEYISVLWLCDSIFIISRYLYHYISYNSNWSGTLTFQMISLLDFLRFAFSVCIYVPMRILSTCILVIIMSLNEFRHFWFIIYIIFDLLQEKQKMLYHVPMGQILNAIFIALYHLIKKKSFELRPSKSH